MKNRKFKYRNAKNIEGILLRSYDDSPSIFRIYGNHGTFKDYEILHDDVSIKILDDSAELIESLDGKKRHLDYSRRVLGQIDLLKEAKASAKKAKGKPSDVSFAIKKIRKPSQDKSSS